MHLSIRNRIPQHNRMTLHYIFSHMSLNENSKSGIMQGIAGIGGGGEGGRSEWERGGTSGLSLTYFR
jgi:hypothetical protein